MTEIKVGDRVQFKNFCINHDEDVKVSEGDYGTVVSVDKYGVGVVLDTPEYISVNARDLEPAPPTDPKSEFLKELQALLVKYDAHINCGSSGFDGEDPYMEIESKDFFICYSEEYRHDAFKFPLTADNIMEFDK